MKLRKINSINGNIILPGDKSISHRAIMIASISSGISEISGLLMSEDCKATINCFRDMGVDITILSDKIIVSGVGLKGLINPNKTLYTANSGTTTRLLAGILSGQNFSSVILGDDSLNSRPMDRIIIPLKLMMSDIKGSNCPISISPSSLVGIQYCLPMPSAQVKSCILFAGLYADKETQIFEKIPSRNHTELMLKHFGANIIQEDNIITIYPAKELQAKNINICADISSALFWIVAAIILPNSFITLENVGINPTRIGAIDVLISTGANISFSNFKNDFEKTATIVAKSSNIKSPVISGDIIPRLIDEIPILCVMGIFSSGTMIIKDAQELKIKESNRISAMVTELLKAGIDIKETETGMIIGENHNFKDAHFSSHNDHRIAMALSIFAMKSPCNYTIDNPDCVAVSYPDFYKHLNELEKK